MYRFLMNHTFVLLILMQLYATTLVPEDWRQQILEAHNKYRQAIRNCSVPNQPVAKSMPLLIWNHELETSAQRWANNCQLGHDDTKDRMTDEWAWVGQNVAGVPNVFDAVKLWFEEHKNYDYKTNTCTDVCGHYTQVVWASTLQIGCGYRWCKSETFVYDYLLVCNYAPGGNYADMKPYDADDSKICSNTDHINRTVETSEELLLDFSLEKFDLWGL